MSYLNQIDPSVYHAYASLLIAIAILWFIGDVIISLLGKKGGVWSGSTIFIGIPIVTMQLVVYGVFGIGWNIFTIVLPYLALSAGLPKLRRRYLAVDVKKYATYKNILTATILFTVFSVIAVHIISLPLTGWDAIAMWMYKAKVYYINESLSYKEIVIEPLRNPDYPPVFSLITSFLYSVNGSINESLGKSSVLIYILGTFQFTHQVSKLYAKKYKLEILIITLLMVIGFGYRNYTFSTVYLGYADYIVGLMMAIIMLTAYISYIKKDKDIALLAIALGTAATLHKYEAAATLGISSLVYLYLIRQEKGKPVDYVKQTLKAGLLTIPFLGWYGLTKVEHFPSYLDKQTKSTIELISEAPGRLNVIIDYYYSFWRDDKWAMMLTPLLILLIVMAIKRPKIYSLLLIFIVGQLALYTFIYLITPINLVTQLKTSADRLIVQLTLMFLVAIIGILIANSDRKLVATLKK